VYSFNVSFTFSHRNSLAQRFFASAVSKQPIEKDYYAILNITSHSTPE
jgi:DnaJ-class molecular chaperone